jgi:hypothetical protein
MEEGAMLGKLWNQGIRAGALGLLAAIGIFGVACGGSSTVAKPPFTATEMIQKASVNFAADNALHFTLTADNIAPGLYAVRTAQGDIVRPDRMKITGKSEITKGFLANVGIIIVGQNQYLDAGGTGAYKPTSGLPDLLAIFSANQGIGAILNQFQSPSAPVAAQDAAKISCWKITGTVDSTLLAPFTGSTSTTPSPVNATLWIGQADYQIHQVTLQGKAADDDTDQSVRTFTLSNYNEQVTISAPQS